MQKGLTKDGYVHGIAILNVRQQFQTRKVFRKRPRNIERDLQTILMYMHTRFYTCGSTCNWQQVHQKRPTYIKRDIQLIPVNTQK